MQPLSSIDRRVGMRMRADLVVSPVDSSGVTTWILKDPLTLEHFQFSAEEYSLMDWLREEVSIAELQWRFNRRFSPQTIRPEAIWEFLSRLHTSGLLIADAPGQGHELLARRDRERLKRWAFSWTGLLGIRFPGVDPDRVLTFIRKEFGWLFSPMSLVPLVAVVVWALAIFIGHFDEFRSRLPALSALVDWHNLPWLLLAIGGVKVLHELGHALTCKRFGGDVHEIGFMLLVFSPCLYCDVSDAWHFPSKWRRIAVSAAGIAVELLLATVATIVWWYAQPGVVQLVALNVMIICTVNTLLINGNPLMRYDGYYIFSDLAETPNLWQRSREALKHFWSDWLLGQPPTEDALIPASKRPLLAAYAVLSKVYMLLVCVTIVWGVVKFLHPYHLENAAYLVGCTVLAGAAVTPIRSAVELMRNPIRRSEVRAGRVSLVSAIAVAALVAILAVPVNYNVRAPLALMPADAARVYAPVGGTLVKVLPAGAAVKRGEVVGQLRNTEAELEVARLEGELAVRRLHVEHLERLRGVDTKANDELPTARSALADSQRRLDERRSEARRLTLVAPTDGIVLLAPRKFGDAHPTRLPEWSGSLLDPHAVGAHVEAGTLVCLVGDPRRLTAEMLISDSDVKELRAGQHAHVRLDELPGQVLEGEVIEVARHEFDPEDTSKVQRADLAPLFAGLVAPGQTGPRYKVSLAFGRGSSVEGRGPDDTASLVIGGRGEAKVTTERITLGRWVYRFLAQTFRLPM